MSNPSNLNTTMTSKQSQRHFDNHTLYIRSGFLTQAQVDGAFNVLLQELRDIYANDDEYGPLMNKATFIANVVTNTKGDMFRITFVHVSEPAVYYILLGKNPDGSDRFEEYDDPDWTPPTSERREAPSGMTSWADIAEFEEEEEAAHNHPKLIKTFPPIAVLPLIQLSAEQAQRELNWLQLKAKEEGKDEGEIDRIELPRYGYFNVEPAFVEDPQPGECENILCCRIAPEWINVDMIRDKFQQFSTDLRLHFGKIKGKEQKYTFPTFNIGENVNVTTRAGKEVRTRMVYVTCSPYTKDASFALHMCKKFDITNNKTKEKALLIFSHWRSTQEPTRTGSNNGGDRRGGGGDRRDNRSSGNNYNGNRDNRSGGNNNSYNGSRDNRSSSSSFSPQTDRSTNVDRLPTPSTNAWSARPKSDGGPISTAPRIVKIGEGHTVSATSPPGSPKRLTATERPISPITITSTPSVTIAAPTPPVVVVTPPVINVSSAYTTNVQPPMVNTTRITTPVTQTPGFQWPRGTVQPTKSRSEYKPPTVTQTSQVIPTTKAPVVRTTGGPIPVGQSTTTRTAAPVVNQWAARSAAAKATSVVNPTPQ
jgi:hypothetical protein